MTITIASIFVKFLLIWLVVGCCWSDEIDPGIFLENQLGFEANLTPVPYSTVYQDATFEPMTITIASIFVKFLLIWLVVGWCWSDEIDPGIFLENQLGFEANLTPVPYSNVYQDATFEPVCVRIAPILMKF
jgi:hypothetical protein